MNKDFQLLFEYARIKFTSTDNKIADYFLARNPVRNIEELAAEIGVSTASITRFCKKVGLNNFKEFLFIYQQQLDEEKPQQSVEPSSLHHDYVDVLQQFDKRLDMAQTTRFSQAINQHDVIHVFGSGYSALAGADFKFRFTRLGKYIEVVQDSDSMQMVSSILKPGALVILLTLKGKNERMINYAQQMKSKGITVLCITANEKSKLVNIADATMLTASLHGEESTGMISGQMPILMAIDHIYYQYVYDYRDTIQNWVVTEQPFVS
ncbi:MurR/RpiR family transcriptional regulator [Photobacterium sp. SDRW27]|uniref:MurR/RpiR family transcriptional regulator n=1 Tax=Photobacterium obscurum TaxID=2829490 RepID=UPI002243D979|nr:MurR/RpiR family transcriptional regulator [Photobacterium obscurum]MCW8329221.1 MurR/RpiR family transcriptional regulator [Photobacterium obscurum]